MAAATLTDALAAALGREVPMPDYEVSADAYMAAAILADPAFREALTAALAEALDSTPREWGRFKGGPCAHGDPCTESACPEYGRFVYAAAVVAAMLP